MKSTSQKLILLSFLLAMLAAIAVFLYLQSLKNPTIVAKKTTILVAAETIPPRTLIDKKMVKEIEVTDNTMFKDYISDSSKIVGQYTKETILRNEGFLKEKLISGNENELSLKIDKDFRALSINATGDSGVSRLLKAGDFVDVVVYLGEKKDGAKVDRPDIAKIILQNIQVLAVDQQLDREEKITDKEKALATFLVTLAVPTSDLEKLVLAESIGTIKLALRPLKDNGSTDSKGATDVELLVDTDNSQTPPSGSKPPAGSVSKDSGNAKKYVNYTVKPGDTLKKISTYYYGDPSKYVIIKEANNIENENLILNGEVLRIPILQ